MRIRIALLSFMITLIFIGPAFSDAQDEARSLFYRGNAHYSEEKFEEAVGDYESALGLGFESGPLYYNLGNAYFKNGDLGKAILNYLRARRLTPRDADLKSNLDYARSLIKGGVIVPGRNWFEKTFFKVAYSFSLHESTLMCTILYFAASIFIILAVMARPLRRVCARISWIISVLLVIGLFLFYAQFYKVAVQKEAVVLVKSTDAKFEPFDDATAFFTLNEGECVAVTASEGGWVKVKRPDGRQGWIKESDTEFL